MTYIALARKYRPQRFDDLLGQPHVTQTLTKALESQRIGQAYLFTGQRGVGKTSAARILAKCLNCAHGPTPTPCDTCPSCTQIAQGRSLDVVEIDGASNRGIDEIRQLRETVPYSPTTGAFRVYIIDEVHMLTTEAFNALLKTLEEPPAHVKFIFATTAANKVPPTILSRCQRFDFRRIESGLMVDALRRLAAAEQLTVEDAALYAVARAADGSLRDAEVVLEQLASFADGTITEPTVTALLGAVESDALVRWTQAILDRHAPQALALVLEQLERGKDEVQLLTGLLRQLRNVLLVRTLADAPARDMLLSRLVDEAPERLQQLQVQAAPWSVQELLVLLQMATSVYELIRRSPVAQTLLELLVIKLATRDAWQSLDELARRLEHLSTRHDAGEAIASTSTASHLTAVEPTARLITRPPESQTATTNPAPSPLPSAESVGGSSSVAAPAAGQLPGSVHAVWTTFLERLGSQKMSLAAYLMDAQPLGCEQGLLTVGLPGYALHYEVLSLPDNRRLIDRLLTELSGTSISVQYTTVQTVPAPGADAATTAPRPPGSDSPVIQDIVNLFNATIVDRPQTSSP